MSTNTTGNITAKTIQNEVSAMAMTTTATINATLVDNLAILADIECKLDIIAEILADKGDPHGHRQPQHGRPSS